MIKELCEICQHSGNDYRYKFRTLICQLDNKTPNYRFYCEKVLLKTAEKLKLQEDFNAKINKRISIWKRFDSSTTNFIDEKYKYHVTDFKIEYKINKFRSLVVLISILLISAFAVYHLFKSDFVWFTGSFSFISFFVCIVLIKILYSLIKDLFDNETQLLIDSNGIDDKTNKFIPWELMFNVFVTKDYDESGLYEYYIHIWSLIGDYKISLLNLNFKNKATENLIGYYKNSEKFNKLMISGKSS